MSWYSAAVTGKVPSYVADKEKWDLEGYLCIASQEYMKYERMSSHQLNQAIEYARKYKPGENEEFQKIGSITFIVHT